MNVSITPELEKFVASKVSSGMYHSASEVIRDGLRLLEERDELRRSRIAALNREIQIGLDESERGEGISEEEFEAEMDKFFAELEKKKWLKNI